MIKDVAKLFFRNWGLGGIIFSGAPVRPFTEDFGGTTKTVSGVIRGSLKDKSLVILNNNCFGPMKLGGYHKCFISI